jgi:hypothetical protein
MVIIQRRPEKEGFPGRIMANENPHRNQQKTGYGEKYRASGGFRQSAVRIICGKQK